MKKVRSLVEQVETLRKWLARRGFSLVMGASNRIEDSVEFDTMIVFINTRSSLRNQVYSLLHECGHVSLRSNVKKYYKKYPFTKTSEVVDGRKAQSNTFLVELLDEEIQAWREGEKIANRHNFAMNRKEYKKYGSIWVMWYVKKIGRWGYRGILKSTKELKKRDETEDKA